MTIRAPPTPSRTLRCSAGSSTIAIAADQRGVVANRTCAWVGDTRLCACARCGEQACSSVSDLA